MNAEAKLKALWYLLFATFGVFHAEVLSGSQPFVLLNPLWFGFVTPVYAVHYVVFGDLLLRYRKKGFAVVYTFGCLTGMYEFVITKVYFVPPWNPAATGPLGIAWLELLWIGFLFHALFSFLIPFRLLVGLFGPGRGEPSQDKGLSRILIIVPAFAAALGLGFQRSLVELLVTTVGSLGVITLISLVFLRQAKAAEFRTLDQLVLGPRGRRYAVAFFVSVYAAYGLLLRTESFPIGPALIVVALLYALLITVVVRRLREPSEADTKDSTQTPAALESTGPLAAPNANLAPQGPGSQSAIRFLARYALQFAIFIVGFGVAAAFLPILFWVLAGLMIYAGAVIGAALVGFVVVQTFVTPLRKPRNVLTQPPSA